MSALAGAVETAPVSSLHSIGSANPDDFAVPTGREEEWRFTPLNKLRKLHADAPLGSSGVTVAVEAAPELVVEKQDYSERVRLAPDRQFLPTDRISARAFAAVVEATVSRVSEEQLFYLMSRGLPEDEAMAMIVRGFIEPIARELPMEYALELNKLIEMGMEGSVG
jgi:hypothetical protein